MECEIGSKAFIIESNRIIREVTIVRKNSDFYVVRFDTEQWVHPITEKSGILIRRGCKRASFKEQTYFSDIRETVTISVLALKSEMFKYW